MDTKKTISVGVGEPPQKIPQGVSGPNKIIPGGVGGTKKSLIVEMRP